MTATWFSGDKGKLGGLVFVVLTLEETGAH